MVVENLLEIQEIPQKYHDLVKNIWKYPQNSHEMAILSWNFMYEVREMIFILPENEIKMEK